jgi:hypothetical protein
MKEREREMGNVRELADLRWNIREGAVGQAQLPERGELEQDRRELGEAVAANIQVPQSHHLCTEREEWIDAQGTHELEVA